MVGRFEMPSRAYVGRFNFKGPDQQKRVGDLSGGERNRVHLAKLLKSGGNVLLLDEPTNDLDVETLRALEEALLVFPGCASIASPPTCWPSKATQRSRGSRAITRSTRPTGTGASETRPTTPTGCATGGSMHSAPTGRFSPS